MLLGVFPAAAFAEGVTDTEGKVLIPFEKTWNDDNNALETRPDSITVTLYKYTGTQFDSNTAILVESKTITAGDGWKYTFDISDQQIIDESGETYKFKVVESPVASYNESAHTDPEVIFTPPADKAWDRITPCAELQITSSGTEKSVVVAKKGNEYVIWTLEALSPAERQIIFESAKANIKGFGQGDFNNAVFISGIGGSSNGMTITEDKITFDNPKDWSFFATGLYSKSTTEANGAAITNTLVPTTGSLTIAKDFGANSEIKADSENVGSFNFTVKQEEKVVKEIQFPIVSSQTPWEYTITDLPAGSYSVIENVNTAQRDGYDLVINQAGEDDDAVEVTVTAGETAEAKITNTYTKKMGEDIVNPASFKILKTDESDKALSGAEFTLYNKDGSVNSTVTTNDKGEAVFGGFTKAAEYTLKETKAPTNYALSDQTWTVTVKLKDGDPTIQISQDGSHWNKVFNWVVSTDSKDFDGVLTVLNKLKTGSLTVTKTVENNKKLGPEASEYKFSLTIDGQEQSFTLKDGESKTFKNIPYGTAYTVLEEVDDNASWNVKTPDAGVSEGIISQDSTTVEFVNRYEYTDQAEMAVFSAVKQSSKDGKALAGAEFTVYSDKDCKNSVATASSDANGKLAFGFKSEGSYYVKETKAPKGYVLSDKVIEITVSNKGYAVDRVENDDQSVTVTIVPVLQLSVKGAELLTGSTSVFVLENDPETYIDITVNKVWKNDKEAGKRPDTITVILYKDGEKYDSKTISEKDKWTCTWKDLPSQYKWTVDEGSLPAGYTKDISLKGTTFTITNTYSSIVQTGDNSAPILWALLAMATAVGAVLTVKKLRKENG